jgi:pyruvate dehydrogenase E1 component alpha subunit
VRAGSGPRLLHAVTYRVKGHVSVDPAAYRDPKEVEAALRLDPIALAREAYLGFGGVASALDAISTEAQAEVQRAMDAAEQAPWPDAQDAFTDVQTTGAGQWR